MTTTITDPYRCGSCCPRIQTAAVAVAVAATTPDRLSLISAAHRCRPAASAELPAVVLVLPLAAAAAAAVVVVVVVVAAAAADVPGLLPLYRGPADGHHRHRHRRRLSRSTAVSRRRRRPPSLPDDRRRHRVHLLFPVASLLNRPPLTHGAAAVALAGTDLLPPPPHRHRR
ncbi:unnamed protein product [Ectocarpus sp. 12 AP-2014]